MLSMTNDVAVAKLLLVSGMTGAVYTLTAVSRTPLALGSAPQMTVWAAGVESGLAMGTGSTGTLVWVLVGLAAVACALLLLEMRQRHHTFVPVGTGV